MRGSGVRPQCVGRCPLLNHDNRVRAGEFLHGQPERLVHGGLILNAPVLGADEERGMLSTMNHFRGNWCAARCCAVQP